MTNITQREGARYKLQTLICLLVRGASWRVLLEQSIMLRLFFVVKCGIARFMRYVCIRRSSIILISQATTLPNIIYFATYAAELGREKNCVLNHSLNLLI